MSPSGGQLLVLRHVEGLAIPTLAGIYALTPRLIRTALVKAGREFIELLGGTSWDHEIKPDVHSLLTGLTARLDADWVKEAAECVLHHPARREGNMPTRA